jgi:hypothetical protein
VQYYFNTAMCRLIDFAAVDVHYAAVEQHLALTPPAERQRMAEALRAEDAIRKGTPDLVETDVLCLWRDELEQNEKVGESALIRDDGAEE